MKHRWMDVVKRSTLSLGASSPRADANASAAPPSASASASASAASPARASLRRPRSLPTSPVRQRLLLSPAGSHKTDGASSSLSDAPETLPFVHYDDRCESIGECSVPQVLDRCVLQAGVHHTHMNVLTYLGNPLRAETCCYLMGVQWFRAVGDRDDFQLIPDACDEWFTPTADDIGARILAKVAMQDEDAIRTKLLEYGPIKEDPEVRSKVELYLERRSVLFMGLESVSIHDGENYPSDAEIRESWTLLIDDRRVRVTCESSLLPPFEAFYSSAIRVDVVRHAPTEFVLFLSDDSFVHLRAESHVVRDIIVLTLRAFCKSAVSSVLISDAIAKGISPMLAIRTLADAEQRERQQRDHDDASACDSPRSAVPEAPLSYSLPWNKPVAAAGAIVIDEDNDDDSEASSSDEETEANAGPATHHTTAAAPATATLPPPPPPSSGRRAVSKEPKPSDEINDSILQDADALIDHALKMGVQHQMLPRAPKRISVTEIADLQIIELQEAASATDNNARNRRQASGRKPERDEGSSSPEQTDDDDESESSAAAAAAEAFKSTAKDSVSDAIEAFKAQSLSGSGADVEELRSQYVAIFCELQRELSEQKARVAQLTERLEQKTTENRSFRNDIATLQDALTSVQVAEKVKEMVTNDLQQLIRAKDSKSPMTRVPQNFY
ncbi:hypothetical protein P43SY_003554 [Pythium insidiosum]|uniref:Uncharacterized protein n=1 Tax=Pythium insidiosum TaxID=114742 RepID=A0AAD5LB57_PYTIN|nr:hypothetical protein P43SY_003554 [Pythium insidiosum]